MGRVKKAKGFTGGFLMLPHALLHGQKYRSLSFSARSLLVDIASQYNGKNNGDFCIAWEARMKHKGYGSEATVHKAKKELLDRGFIAETRKGGRNRCSLYGITWQPLDENPKLDVKRASFPNGAWHDEKKS